MKDGKFNAKKFLKGIKNELGKKAPIEEDAREEDLDSLNEEQLEEDGDKKGAKKSKIKKVFNKVGGFFDPEPQ